MLLDTSALLWLVTDEALLGGRTRQAVDRALNLYASAASMWEIAIKARRGRIAVEEDFLGLVEAAQMTWLPVTPQHAWVVRHLTGLPQADPFDRLLLAQAATEDLTFVTADRAILGATVSPSVSVLDARQ